jgi:hypothetical protein
MDFMQLLRSLQEMLYEVMSWLVFYPRTLWRVVRAPVTMTRVSETELGDNSEDQFAETLSPPLFLLLSVILVHTVETMLGVTPAEAAEGGWLGSIAGKPQNLLIYRSFMFSLLPIVAAVEFLRRRGVPLDRTTLRAPFYSQCYLAGPFVVGFSVGQTLALNPDMRIAYAGAAVGLFALGWYSVVLAIWFTRRLEAGRVKGALAATRVLLLCLLTHMTLTSLMAADLSNPPLAKGPAAQ